jgi:hypothetical protein
VLHAPLVAPRRCLQLRPASPPPTRGAATRDGVSSPAETGASHRLAILLGSVVGAWLGVFGVLAGAAALASSIVQAHAGFSDIAMATSMPSALAMLLWSACVGVVLLRSAGAAGPPGRTEGEVA